MKRTTRLLAIGLTLAAGTGPLRAEEELELGGLTLDPVIVEATKQGQELFDVDGMVGIATPEDLTPRNITNLDEIDRVFPDMLIRPRGNRAYDSITIRGQSSVDFYNPSVQVYVDGLPQDQTTFGQLLPSDLEQVEVLYGPQGTLYGRSAVGGVINVVTRKPDEALLLKADGGFGNLERDVRLLASGPILPEVLFGDVALNYQKLRGEYESPADGSRLGDSEDWNGRVRLRLAPTDGNLDVLFLASHDRLHSDEEQYVLESDIDSRIAFPVQSDFTLTTDSLGLTAAYDFGLFKVTSLTGYQDRDLDRTGFDLYQPEHQKTVNQELRLALETERVGLLFGGYYQHLHFEREVPAYVQTSEQKIDSYALFGEATWHVTERLDVTGGLRFDYERAEATAGGTVSLSGSDDSNAVSPKVAVGYQVTDGLRAYALYSTGFRPGGFTRNVSVYNIAYTYDPQTSQNFEIGLRGDLFGGDLQFTAAAYYTTTQNYQTFVGTQPFQYLQNVGDVAAKGIDLQVTAMPIDDLRITAGLGLNRTEYTSYDNPADPSLDLSGETVPYAPPVTANLNLEYALDLPQELGLLVPHAGFQYVGKTYFDELNTVSQSGYALYDAGLVWSLGPVTAEAYADNLLNKTYTTYGFAGAAYYGEDLYQVGPGRSFGLRLRVAL